MIQTTHEKRTERTEGDVPAAARCARPPVPVRGGGAPAPARETFGLRRSPAGRRCPPSPGAAPRPPDTPPPFTGAPRGVRGGGVPARRCPPAGRHKAAAVTRTHTHTRAATREDEEEPPPSPPRNWTWHNEHRSAPGPPRRPRQVPAPSCAGRPRSLGRTGDTRLSPAPGSPSPRRPPRPPQVCGGPRPPPRPQPHPRPARGRAHLRPASGERSGAGGGEAPSPGGLRFFVSSAAAPARSPSASLCPSLGGCGPRPPRGAGWLPPLPVPSPPALFAGRVQGPGPRRQQRRRQLRSLPSLCLLRPAAAAAAAPPPRTAPPGTGTAPAPALPFLPLPLPGSRGRSSPGSPLPAGRAAAPPPQRRKDGQGQPGWLPPLCGRTSPGPRGGAKGALPGRSLDASFPIHPRETRCSRRSCPAGSQSARENIVGLRMSKARWNEPFKVSRLS
ncbi:basic proline-rich protein-like [Passer montanus]|uniref:basic proline-rich protein-like n=1 Tax=Passer montanus TaxID=9160 RepID=UPI001960155F|nr:basic proline-rich protein-like [Passer montanus]